MWYSCISAEILILSLLTSNTKPEEDVVDLFPDVRSEAEQFAIDTMQYGLQIFPLSGVLTIKQLQQLGTQQ